MSRNNAATEANSGRSSVRPQGSRSRCRRSWRFPSSSGRAGADAAVKWAWRSGSWPSLAIRSRRINPRNNSRSWSSAPSSKRRPSKAPYGKGSSGNASGRSKRHMLERSSSLRPSERIGSSACVNQSSQGGAFAKIAFNFAVSSAQEGRAGYRRESIAQWTLHPLHRRGFLFRVRSQAGAFRGTLARLRTNAAPPGKGQWSPDLRMSVEDQNGEIGHECKLFLAFGPRASARASCSRRFRSI